MSGHLLTSSYNKAFNFYNPIFNTLNIDLEKLDIISLKSRVHFRRGFYESGFAGAIYEIDAPGLGPADLTTIEYKNIPKDIYPVYKRD